MRSRIFRFNSISKGQKSIEDKVENINKRLVRIDNDEKEKLNDLVNSDTGLKKIIEEGINFYKEVFSDDEAALEKVRYKPMTQ